MQERAAYTNLSAWSVWALPTLLLLDLSDHGISFNSLVFVSQADKMKTELLFVIYSIYIFS